MSSLALQQIADTYRADRPAVDALFERSRVEGTPFGITEYRSLDFFTITAEPDLVDYTHVDAGGVPAIWARPLDAVTDRALVYFHGGAYAQGSAAAYRHFCGHVAKAVGVRVLIVDHRLGPEHPHPAAITDATAAYRWLLEQGFDPAHLAVAGDSSGGGLAFALLLALKQQGLPFPVASVPISPWTDMRGISPSLATQSGIDLLVTEEAMQAATFLGEDGDQLDPLASPVLGDHTGVTTRIYVQVDGDEALHDEAIAAVDQTRRGGVERGHRRGLPRCAARVPARRWAHPGERRGAGEGRRVPPSVAGSVGREGRDA